MIVMKKAVLSPSLLSADFSNLACAVRRAEEKNAAAIHIDVMDGHFVPQISFGQPFIQSVRKLTSLPFDVHLMIERPDESADSFLDAGADWLTFHFEACVHSNRLIQRIHDAGKKCGIAIVPSTPVSAIEELLPLADLILVMTVNPGFAAQTLIRSCVKKIARLAQIKKDNDFEYKISVDGGVNKETIADVISAGADIVVSGSAFFSGALDSFDFSGLSK